jgi:hypothetical protein
MMIALFAWFHGGGWVLVFAVGIFVAVVVGRWMQRRDSARVADETRREIVQMIQEDRAAEKAEAGALDAATGETELTRAQRKAKEYFALIRTMEDQKNRYKVFWLEQAREHAVTQGLYERTIVEVRRVASRAIAIANHYMEKEGKPKIVHPRELAGPPEGIAAEYRAKIEAQIASCPPEGDVEADLRRIGPPEDPAPPAAPADKPAEGSA